MSLGKRLIKVGLPACTTDTTDIFGDSTGVALYSLDYDASDAGGLYDGTPTNVEFGVGGQINYGARFNGSSSYIDTGISSLGTTFSVSMWINEASLGSGGFFGNWNSTSNDDMFWRTQSDGSLRINFDGAGTQYFGSAGDVTANNWHHIVVTFNNGSINVYLDGSSKGSTTTANTAFNSGANFYIGDDNSGTYFDGSIDQVRLFSKALSSSEVSTLYAETACVYTCTTDTVDYPTTNVAYYKLDNSAEDETGNYDGTPTNVNYTFGRFGQAGVFNGSSGYIDTTYNFGTDSSYSISLWMKTSITSTRHFLYGVFPSSGANNGPGFAFGISASNTFEFIFANGSAAWVDTSISAASYTNGNWHNLILVVNDTLVKLYADGNTTPIANLTSSVSAGTSTSDDLSLGRLGSYPGFYFNGKIDQVRIFSSALTSTQVESLYNEKPCEDTSNFKTVLWDMDGVNGRYISNVGFEPDFVWIKDRDDTSIHVIFDSVRGATNYLSSSSTAVEASSSTTLQSFEANGFTLGNSGAVNDSSGNGAVAWVWKAGGDAVAGSGTNVSNITQSVNAEAGFSIVKYTEGSGSTSFNHGLGVEPDMTIIKRTNLSGDWLVLTNAIDGSYDYLVLNSTAQANTSSYSSDSTSINVDIADGGTFIAYCFHSVSGYSKIGSYTGTGAAGNSITTGFEPTFVMIKRTDSTGNWVMFDGARGDDDDYLYANTDAAEGTPGFIFNLDVSGFTLGGTASWTNASGGTYIYMAFK